MSPAMPTLPLYQTGTALFSLLASGIQPPGLIHGVWGPHRLLPQVGGAGYLTEILDAAPVVANVAAYGRIIHEKFRIRAVILACQRVSAQGYVDYGEPQAFIDGAEQAIYNIARTSTKQSSTPPA